VARFVNTFEALYGDFAEEDVIHLIPTAVDDVASFISTSPYLSPFFSCAQALSLHPKWGSTSAYGHGELIKRTRWEPPLSEKEGNKYGSLTSHSISRLPP
jgi:hypothetical protein